MHLWVDGAIVQNASSAFHAAELLATVLGHTAAADVAELGSIQVLELALQLPLEVADILEYLTFGRISLVFLENETLHDQLAQRPTFIKILRLLEDNVDRVRKIAIQNEDEKEDLEAVVALGDQILACVCDISLKITAPEDFTNDILVKQLRDWIQRQQGKLATCACLVLGNLARSDSVCELMTGVNAEGGTSCSPESPPTTPIHLDLLRTLKANSEKSLTHAALGFLSNLAHPRSNKETLGSAGAVEIAVSLISASAFESEVNLAVIRLVRQLLRDSFENSRRLLRPVLPELMHWFKAPSESPSLAATDAVSTDSSTADTHTSDVPQTFLSVFLQLNIKTDRLEIRMEIGRTVVCACRTFHSMSGQTEDVEESLAMFYKHSEVSRAVVSMVTQGQWPALRSEGWFGLGLMARSKDGARLLGYELKAEPFFAIIRTTMEQRQSSDTEEVTIKREDRENAIVLVHGLINNAVRTFRECDINSIAGYWADLNAQGDALDPRHRNMMLSLLNQHLKDVKPERTSSSI